MIVIHISQTVATASTSVAAVVVKPTVYRPPGSSGSASNFMTKETVAIGKVPKPIANPSTLTSSAAKYVPKQRIIPGMPPPSAASGGKKSSNGGKPK